MSQEEVALRQQGLPEPQSDFLPETYFWNGCFVTGIF